ncbi:hypothetical protein Q1695_013718 [Nippostrongylus brasiliensis]|nr:hypothetical protein Q1695_013718 [Nippostrongylus brasiliensis]
MLGVIIFVRMSWITNEVGLAMTIGFILLALLVSFLTTMSVAAISTEQRHGFFASVSTYFSPAVAAGLSVLYVFSNTLAFAAFIVALSETLVNFLRNAGVTIVDGSVNDMRIFSAVLCAILLLVATLRSRDHFKCRLVMMVLVLVAVLLQMIGLLVPSWIIERRVNATSFKISDYNPYDEKAMGFVVYFPAVTCVFAGLSIRGRFERKKDDIFRGSSVALVLSSLLYMVTAILEAHFTTGSELVLNQILGDLHHHPSVTVLRSLPITVFVLLSCFYCSYTAFITAAQCVQDVGNSPGLVPGWNNLARGYGTDGSPRIAFAVLAVAGLAISMIGEFNIIVSIMTIYFLTTYCILNYAAFMSTLKSERPSYRWYFRFLGLLGSMLCVHIMLAVSWKLTNAALLTFLKFYIYVKWKQSQKKAGQNVVGSPYASTLGGLQNMERKTDLAYKPQVLLLCGNPATRPALVDFADNIIMGRSLFICGFVIPQAMSSRAYIVTEKVERQMSEWLSRRGISAFAATVPNKKLPDGAATLLQTAGVGKMRPNILMVGFKTNWEKDGAKNLDIVVEYYEIVLNAFEKNVGVVVFRNSDTGFDLRQRLNSINEGGDADENGIDTDPYPQCNENDDSRRSSQKSKGTVGGILRTVASFIRRNDAVADSEANDGMSNGANRFQLAAKHSVKDLHDAQLVIQLNRFRTPVLRGTIDVWWLRDDGGMTLLLPYLLRLPGSYLKGARLRVFVEGARDNRVANEQKNMATLMKKFHVDSSDLHVIGGFDLPPGKSTTEEFGELIRPFRDDGSGKRHFITDEDLQNLRQKTGRYLRTSELVQQYSRESDLVVVTMPIPRRSTTPPPLYVAWLEMLSRNLPPTILVRGNRQSVLSYFD